MQRTILFLGILSLSFRMYAQAQPTPQPPGDTTQQVIPGRANNAKQEQQPYVILISADGFRHDLADKYQAKNLQHLRSQGVAASSMMPSYPSVTFPNHYSLATGLYPSHHGLVNNTFFDPAKGRGYRISDRNAVRDSSWYGGIPIWVLAEQQHMLSASFFWVGSEAAVDGVRPTYFYWFNDKIPLDTRLQRVKNWLTLPQAERPHLILFYLSQVDHAEHVYGPNSVETEAAVHLVDDCIGRMTKMVDSLHLPVNFIFVSDHGMASIDTAHGVTLPTVDTTKFMLTGGEIMQHVYAKNKADILPEYRRLKKQADGYDVYLPNETPAHWHYTKRDDRFDRMGDILLVAKYPRMFFSHGKTIAGEHGFDNTLPDMGATFYAWGPAFKQQEKIPAFENVNVYPLVAHILGLTIHEKIDGALSVLQPVLR